MNAIMAAVISTGRLCFDMEAEVFCSLWSFLADSTIGKLLLLVI